MGKENINTKENGITLQDLTALIDTGAFIAVAIPEVSNWIPAYIGEMAGLWQRPDLMCRTVQKLGVDTFHNQRGLNIYLN